MRYVFNSLAFCFFVVLSFRVNAQVVNQSVNWDSTLISCSREQDAHEKAIVDAAKQFAGRAQSPFNTKYVINELKIQYYPSVLLVDSINRGISEVEQNIARTSHDSSSIDRVSQLKLTGCLLRAGLKQASQSASSSSGQQRAPDLNSNQEEVARNDVNQSIALAQQNQAKAEEKRKKDGRRRNRPDLVASDCLTPDTGPRDHGFSVFKNSCSEPVEYTYCTVGAQEGSLTAFVSCTNKQGNRGGGSGSVRAGGESAAPMRGASEVHWLACKRPARAITRGFENGKLVGDCIDLGA